MRLSDTFAGITRMAGLGIHHLTSGRHRRKRIDTGFQLRRNCIAGISHMPFPEPPIPHFRDRYRMQVTRHTMSMCSGLHADKDRKCLLLDMICTIANFATILPDPVTASTMASRYGCLRPAMAWVLKSPLVWSFLQRKGPAATAGAAYCRRQTTRRRHISVRRQTPGLREIPQHGAETLYTPPWTSYGREPAISP